MFFTASETFFYLKRKQKVETANLAYPENTSMNERFEKLSELKFGMIKDNKVNRLDVKRKSLYFISIKKQNFYSR